MRIATWNVNSLKARLEKVAWWLERTAPDVLLLQETKLTDADAPHAFFRERGYELAHHGQGRWNGVAIASKLGVDDVVTNFGEPLVTGDAGDAQPLGETRMIAATCGGVRCVSLYAPNGRTVGSRFWTAKLEWFGHLDRWIGTLPKADALVVGGDLNVAPDDRDVWDPKACHGGTHVSPEERSAFERLLGRGLVDAYRARHEEAERYTWWDYRAGDFYKNYGMRIDHLLLSAPAAARIALVEIDREARKGKPIPSDHAPLLVDLDEPGRVFDAGWASASERIAARRDAAKKKSAATNKPKA